MVLVAAGYSVSRKLSKSFAIGASRGFVGCYFAGCNALDCESAWKLNVWLRAHWVDPVWGLFGSKSEQSPRMRGSSATSPVYSSTWAADRGPARAFLRHGRAEMRHSSKR